MDVFKIWILLPFIFLLIFSGCKNDNTRMTDLLKSIDTVKLNDLGGVTYSETFVKTMRGINIFKNIIHLKKENLPYSKVIREIEFYSKGKLFLKAFESKMGINYTFNGEDYCEKISDEAAAYQSDPQIFHHPDFIPTPNNPLDQRIYTLKIQRIQFSCDCADWATVENARKYNKQHTDDDHDIFMFLEPADKQLRLPDTVGYQGDIVQVTGQFYTKNTYPRGYDTEESVDKGRVFRYTKFKVLKSNYRKEENWRIKTKSKFNVDSPFQIISSFRSLTKQSSSRDTNMCKGWTLSTDHLYQVIKHSKPVSGTQWDLTFDVLPCRVAGQLKQNGIYYEFEVNAGSWMYLESQDTTVIWGDYNRDDRKYFIQGPMRD
jgi:hypothetical protein